MPLLMAPSFRESICIQFKMAEKENKVIYNEIVPRTEDIPHLPRHSMVKLEAPMPNYSDPEVVGEDM